MKALYNQRYMSGKVSRLIANDSQILNNSKLGLYPQDENKSSNISA